MFAALLLEVEAWKVEMQKTFQSRNTNLYLDTWKGNGISDTTAYQEICVDIVKK